MLRSDLCDYNDAYIVVMIIMIKQGTNRVNKNKTITSTSFEYKTN